MVQRCTRSVSWPSITEVPSQDPREATPVPGSVVHQTDPVPWQKERLQQVFNCSLEAWGYKQNHIPASILHQVNQELAHHSYVLEKHPEATRAHFIVRSSCAAACTCVLCCWVLLMCSCMYSLLSLLMLLWSCNSHQCYIAERYSNMGRSLRGDWYWDKEDGSTQVDQWIAWEGLSATLVCWDTTTWSRQAFEPYHGKNCHVLGAWSLAIFTSSLLFSSYFIIHL